MLLILNKEDFNEFILKKEDLLKIDKVECYDDGLGEKISINNWKFSTDTKQELPVIVFKKGTSIFPRCLIFTKSSEEEMSFLIPPASTDDFAYGEYQIIIYIRNKQANISLSVEINCIITSESKCKLISNKEIINDKIEDVPPIGPGPGSGPVDPEDGPSDNPGGNTSTECIHGNDPDTCELCNGDEEEEKPGGVVCQHGNNPNTCPICNKN